MEKLMEITEKQASQNSASTTTTTTTAVNPEKSNLEFLWDIKKWLSNNVRE